VKLGLLSLREEDRLRVFGNRLVRRIFGQNKDDVMGEWRNCITRSFVICTLHHIIKMIKSRRMRWAGHVA
jgi:hypothetical protein